MNQKTHLIHCHMTRSCISCQKLVQEAVYIDCFRASFLIGRRFCVKVDASRSETSTVDCGILKGSQRRITKFFPGLFNVHFLIRLEILNLKSLVECITMNDIIFIFKIMSGLVDLPFENYFSFNTSNTRGHSIKLDISSQIIMQTNLFFINDIDTWDSQERNFSLTSLNYFKLAVEDISFREHQVEF